MDTFEKGSKSKNGRLSVIELCGTWREMGRQYGALMAGELRDIYEKSVGRLARSAANAEAIALSAGKFFANYPYKFKSLMRGMSETSGLTPDELKLVNAIEVIAAQTLEPQRGTGIAAWGDYSDGPLVYGRNYDYLPWFRELSGDLALACFHPGDSSLSVATFGYAGGISAVNGMNEKGIFLELNSGMPSGGALWYDSRVPAVVELLAFLFDASTLDEIESFFKTTKANYAYIVGVADGQTARCFEWPVFDVKRRESHSRLGLTVLTEHFTEFSWGLPRPDDRRFWMTRTRRQNMLALAKHFKGAINDKIMKDILDTRLEDLGATTDFTLYQLVTVPERYEMWFKLPGVQDWSFVDMRALLKPSGE